MNNEYLRYVERYFPNAESVVDSFHVIQWINMELDKFLRTMQKSFADRDAGNEAERSREAGRQVHLPMSDEVYLLKNYRFFLLSNADSIRYHEEPHMDRHFRYLMRTSDYEERFFSIDPSLKELRIVLVNIQHRLQVLCRILAGIADGNLGTDRQCRQATESGNRTGSADRPLFPLRAGHFRPLFQTSEATS